MVSTRLVTVEDVERLPDDGYRYALIRGELYRQPPRVPRQGRAIANVGRLLDECVGHTGSGAVFAGSGFVLCRGPDTLLAPDISYLRADRLPPEGPWEEWPDLTPDLAVAVVSPSDIGPLIEDKVDKVQAYLPAGVRLLWLLDPRRRTVRVRAADGSDRLLAATEVLDGGDVLPGFRLPVARLFE